MIDTHDVFERNERVMAQVIEDESVLLDLDSGMYFALNDVAGTVWGLCDGSRSAEVIADAVCAEYEIDPATAQTDVLELLDALVDSGLLREA